MLAGRVAEVDLAKLWANAHQLSSYFGRIFYLENGRLVFTDIADWYWGFWRWMSRLWDTLLIAYLGTLLGAIGAFFLCFTATVNLAVNPTQRFFARRFLEFCRTVPEIVFALIDSLVLQSGYSNLRLESYLYTEESFKLMIPIDWIG